MKLVVVSVVAAMLLASFVLAQDQTAGATETDRLLDRIGERVNQYYTNLRTVSWNFRTGGIGRTKTLACRDDKPSEDAAVVPETLQFARTIAGGQRYPVVRTLHSFTGFKRFLGDTKINVIEETK